MGTPTRPEDILEAVIDGLERVIGETPDESRRIVNKLRKGLYRYIDEAERCENIATLNAALDIQTLLSGVMEDFIAEDIGRVSRYYEPILSTALELISRTMKVKCGCGK